MVLSFSLTWSTLVHFLDSLSLHAPQTSVPVSFTSFGAGFSSATAEPKLESRQQSEPVKQQSAPGVQHDWRVFAWLPAVHAPAAIAATIIIALNMGIS